MTPTLEKLRVPHVREANMGLVRSHPTGDLFLINSKLDYKQLRKQRKTAVLASTRASPGFPAVHPHANAISTCVFLALYRMLISH